MNLPQKPEESDCCGSGCSPCIFDIYQQQLERYNKFSANQCLDPNTSCNCVSQTKYSLFRLTNIEHESLDTYLYTFTFVLPNSSTESDMRLCYWPGQHFLLRGTDENVPNKYFTRAYTPLVNKPDNHLSFTVLIKLYSDGAMSKFLQKLTLNSETLWRGPYGSYRVNFQLKNILMICQGTGIAPIYSVISQIIDTEVCETMFKLFYCCRNSQTIHLRTDIYNFSSYWNFKYEIFLNHADEHFKPKYKEKIHFRKLQESDLSLYFNNTNCNDSFQVLICGNEHFSKEIKENVKSCGVNEECIYVF